MSVEKTPGKGDPATGPKSRRGVAAKGKQAKAAAFVAGEPAEPYGVPVRAVIDELNVWQHDGTDKILRMPSPTFPYVRRWTTAVLRDELCLAGLSPNPLQGKTYSPIQVALSYLRSERVVMFSGAIGGYPVGIHPDTDGQLMAIINSYRAIEPVEGDCNLILDCLQAKLEGHGGNQLDRLLAWSKTAEAAMSAGERRPGLLLALCGGPDTGKSFIQEQIITPLLGGRVTDPTNYIMGKTSFNEDVARCEHLMMQELPSSDWKNRAQVGEELKKLLVNKSMTLHAKFQSPVTVRPFRRVTISFNDDVDRLKSFPSMTSDFADKVLLLKCYDVPWPMPTRTDEERKAFREAVHRQLPAFVHFLRNWQIPERIRSGDHAARFGLDAWQNKELEMALYEQEPESLVMWALDGTPELYAKRTNGELCNSGLKRAEELRDLILTGPRGERVRHTIESGNSLGRFLSKLAKRFPDRIHKKETNKFNGWIIEPPAEME